MNQTKRVLIVDDEPLAREWLRRQLTAIPGYEISAELGDAGRALQWLSEHTADIVLLDISMPGLSGLEMAERLEQLSEPPAVIFCTAHEDYSLQAFETIATGYLLKPVRREKLQQALERAEKVSRVQRQSTEAGVSTSESYLNVKTHRGLERLDLRTISHFVAEDKYVVAYHDRGETLMEQTLKSLEDDFGHLFARIHRNTLVALNRVVAIERSGGESLVVLEGTEHKPLISRRQLAELKSRLSASPQ